MTTRSLLAGSFLLALHPVLATPLGAQAGAFETRYILQGAVDGDELGRSVAGAGDVNGDGFPDIIVGAPAMSTGGRIRNGVVFVYSGRDGKTLGQLEGEVSGDGLGSSVAGIGDVNQDGFDDVIVGAARADIAGKSDAGSAYVFSGKDGAKLWQTDGAAGDLLGLSVAAAGDVNRDGFPDVIVGAPRADIAGNSDAGSTYVYSGRDGSTLWQFDGVGYRDLLGSSVSGAGDVNRDGYDDVILGAPGASSSGGYAHVYSGRDGKRLLQFSGPYGGFYGPHHRLGTSVAAAGDVNQDGYDDVIVGAPGTTSSSEFPPVFNPKIGSAYVYSGKDGKMIWEFRGSAFSSPFGTSGTRLGGVVAGAGDVNQDGYPDLLAGQSGSPGAVLYSGRDGTRLWEFEDRSIGSLAAAGDVNQDGFPDVIAGSAYPGSGTAFVYVYKPALLWYGTGLAGTGNVIPRIGTGGGLPKPGSSTFKIVVLEAVGGSLCAIAGSVVRAETSVFGGTIYGEFLTPNAFWILGLPTGGPAGYAGLGAATLSIEIPNDSSLVGFTTYWQAFVNDTGSPLPIGVSYTQGLAITVVR